MITTTMHENAAKIDELKEQLADVDREMANLQAKKDAIIQRIDDLGGEEYWRKIFG